MFGERNPGGHAPNDRAPDAHAAASSEPLPKDFDNLVADILENPELVLREDLTPEQVLELQKRINPYAHIAGPAPVEGRRRIAAASYTNLREDYIRRFTATSLVGFLFQVFEEWEVPADQRRWVPAKAAKNAPQPFAAAALVAHLEAALAVAQEAAATSAKAAAALCDAAALDAQLGDGATAEQRAAVQASYGFAEEYAASSAGLLYAATYATHRVGADASARLCATAEAGMKYPEVKETLGRFPLPPPPSRIEMPPAAAKEVVGGFLRHWLKFDPSVHVRSGHSADVINTAVEQAGGGTALVDTKDPSRPTLEAVRAARPAPAAEHEAAVELILGDKRAHDAVVALLRDDDLTEAGLMALAFPATFRQYLYPVPSASPARPAADTIPPQDTFHRWAYYTEVNYEALRTITNAIYPERPDLDFAVALWDVFEGTSAEVDAAFDKHCKRYQDEVTSEIKNIDFGGWTIISSCKQNRKTITFYNKHTEVLKRILDRHAEDARLGADLMRNRIRQVKAQNIAEDGPDAPGLAQYKRNIAERKQDLAGKGAEKVITAEEMRRLERARGNVKAAQELEVLEQYENTIATLGAMEKLRPLTTDEASELLTARENMNRAHEMLVVPDNAVQIDVFTTNPATGEFKKSHFYTKADEGPDAAPAPALPLAPYAVEHILRSAEPRSDADRRAEALGASL